MTCDSAMQTELIDVKNCLIDRLEFLLMAEDEFLPMGWDTWIGAYETSLRMSMWHWDSLVFINKQTRWDWEPLLHGSEMPDTMAVFFLVARLRQSCCLGSRTASWWCVGVTVHQTSLEGKGPSSALLWWPGRNRHPLPRSTQSKGMWKLRQEDSGVDMQRGSKTQSWGDQITLRLRTDEPALMWRPWTTAYWVSSCGTVLLDVLPYVQGIIWLKSTTIRLEGVPVKRRCKKDLAVWS